LPVQKILLLFLLASFFRLSEKEAYATVDQLQQTIPTMFRSGEDFSIPFSEKVTLPNLLGKRIAHISLDFLLCL
jgi:hypothetical protein